MYCYAAGLSAGVDFKDSGRSRHIIINEGSSPIRANSIRMANNMTVLL